MYRILFSPYIRKGEIVDYKAKNKNGEICVRASCKLMLTFVGLCICFHVILYKSHCLIHGGQEIIA